MNPSRDPFGFRARARTRIQGTGPIVVVAQPGQEIRIVVPDDTGEFAARRPSGDSRASPKPGGDSRASPKPGGDESTQGGPFGFKPIRRGFSPTPVTLIARSGQEIRIVVPDESGSIPRPVRGFSGDSRASPRPPGDD